MVLMGWGGASGLQAVVGIFFFTGPVLLLLSTIFLWIQAQFFPMMVCGLFCVFWLSFGVLQLPTLGLAGAYAGGDAAAGAASKEMNAVIALYLLVWGFALGTFWVFTIRINLVFAGIFGFVTVGAWVLSGAYWAVSTGHFERALRLQKVSRGLWRRDERESANECRRGRRCCLLWGCWGGICCLLSWRRRCGGGCVRPWGI